MRAWRHTVVPCRAVGRRHRRRLCGRGRLGLRLRRQLLRGLAGRTQVPTFAMCRPVNMIVPVASVQRGRIRCSKTIIRACSVGWRGNAAARYEKRSDKRNAPIPDMIPSSDTGRELSLLTSIAMRRKSGAGALDCVRIAIRELMEKVAMLRCVKKRDPGAARLLDWVLPPKTVAAISRAFFCNQSS
jgi:hypothetical protein